jgi:hypothetical protein
MSMRLPVSTVRPRTKQLDETPVTFSSASTIDVNECETPTRYARHHERARVTARTRSRVKAASINQHSVTASILGRKPRGRVRRCTGGCTWSLVNR